MPTYPYIRVKLSNLDGNIYGIVTATQDAMRAVSVSADKIDEFKARVESCDNYDAALQVIMGTVNTA